MEQVSPLSLAMKCYPDSSHLFHELIRIVDLCGMSHFYLKCTIFEMASSIIDPVDQPQAFVNVSTILI